MTALYELTQQAIALKDHADELPEEVIADTLESLGIDEKIASSIPLIKQWKAEADMLKAEEARLTAKRKTMENKAESLKKYIVNCMDAMNLKKAGDTLHNISIGKASKVVCVRNEEMIPKEFKRVSISLDKTSLKKALAEGAIPGAELVDGKPRITIK